MRDQQAKAHVLKDYYQMTKPDINLLVILTTLGGIWMASSAPRPAGLVLATLLGTALASASAAVLNGYIDRDIDALMSRTRLRPLPTGRISPHHALLFGICLGVISFVLLVWQVNLLSAVLALGAILFYVGIYTAWLKRSTPLCTVIGGIPGAIPPVIG
ncbi:MAG TPA: UbiA family prenyltransferase, partial [bacterium]|nr:UbiA family prenyltransferase [bacterium]